MYKGWWRSRRGVGGWGREGQAKDEFEQEVEARRAGWSICELVLVEQIL